MKAIKRSISTCGVQPGGFLGLIWVKRRWWSTSQERENVAWRFSGWRIYEFCHWFCGAEGNSNKRLTLTQKTLTTTVLLKEKPQRCFWTRGTETNANNVTYINKWQFFFEKMKRLKENEILFTFVGTMTTAEGQNES